MDKIDNNMDKTRPAPSQFSVTKSPAPGALNSGSYHFVMAAPTGTNLMLEGRSLHLVDHQIAAVSPGESIHLLTPAAVLVSFRHEFFCVRVSRAEVFCDGVVFNRLHTGPIITMPHEDWTIVTSRVDELVRIDRSVSPLREERLIGCLRALLLACADARLMALDLPAVAKSPSAEILSFQDALEKYYLDHPDTEVLATACHISPSRLSRLVKAELGMTITQAVAERLAIEARYRLRSGEKSVKEIAYDLGFSDPLYFSRFFKRHFGKAPTTYFRGGVPG